MPPVQGAPTGLGGLSRLAVGGEERIRPPAGRRVERHLRAQAENTMGAGSSPSAGSAARPRVAAPGSGLDLVDLVGGQVGPERDPHRAVLHGVDPVLLVDRRGVEPAVLPGGGVVAAHRGVCG